MFLDLAVGQSELELDEVGLLAPVVLVEDEVDDPAHLELHLTDARLP